MQVHQTAFERGDSGGVEGASDLAIQWMRGVEYRELQRLRGARVLVAPDGDSNFERGSVAREQLEFYRQGPIYALRDLGTTSGTHLNGVRTEHGAIAAGDVIGIGELVGVVMVVPRSSEVPAFGELASGFIAGPALAAELAHLRRGAPTDVPVMITGETGTGKERVARAIHAWSGRKGRFHALNCAALPPTLAESELFGHERGAFTGADRPRIGHLRAAHGGTLFLDEAAELPLLVQAKLLRAVEEQEVTPLGGTEAVAVDLRIVTAAPKPFDHYVAAKSFRADLYERLAGFQVDIPPLRARREEIPGLFRHFVEKYRQRPLPLVETKLVERLLLHPWRGNVRELELFVRKLNALHGGDQVWGTDAARGLLRAGTEPAVRQPSLTGARDRKDHERLLLKEALDQHRGNLTAAAASVGISRRRAYRLLDPDERAGGGPATTYREAFSSSSSS